MSLQVRKSSIDPTLFEIVEGGRVVREIPVRFRIYKWPRRFASVEEICSWVEKEERRLVKATACRFLAIRSRSSSELKKKLEQRGFSSLLCDETVEMMRRLGFLQDVDLANRLVERELQRGHGPRYIELKLRSLGLDPSLTRRIVTDAKQRQAIRKLLPKLRGAAALQRRGFDIDVILSELRVFR